MADDIASLGFAVDSAPITQGALALKSITESARGASASSKELAAAQGATASATKQVSSESSRLVNENIRLQTTIDSLSGNVSKLAAAMNDNAKANASVSNSAKAANDNLAKQGAAYKAAGEGSKSAAKSFIDAGVETLKIAGYLKFATAVAYNAFPVFKNFHDSGVSKIAPAFNAAGKAVNDFAPIVGKVTATLTPFLKISEGIEMVQLASHFGLAGAAAYALVPPLRAAANHEVLGGIKAIGPAIATITPAATTAGSTIMSALVPTLVFVSKFAIPILALVATFEVLKFAVELAIERIAKSVELLKKSLETGLGVELIQKIELVSKKVGLSADSIIESFKKFQEISKPVDVSFEISKDKSKPDLGTSEFQKRIDELTKAGAFAQNIFVKIYKDAQTAEEKQQAAISLISSALQGTDRLAGLNLLSTFASPEVLAAAKAYPDILQEILDKAKLVSGTKIIDVESVAVAVDLKKRMDEASRILSEKWIPFEHELVKIGMDIYGVWVSIVETIAHSLELAEKFGVNLVGAFKSALNFLVGLIPGIGAINRTIEIINKMRAASNKPVGFAGAAEGFPESKNIEDRRGEIKFYDDLTQKTYEARKSLTEGLLQPAKIKEQTALLYSFYNIMKQTADIKLFAVDTTEWDKAAVRVSRYIVSLQSEAATVTESQRAHEEMRVELQLLDAATRTNVGVTQDQIDKYIELRPIFGKQAALILANIQLTGDMAKQMERMGTSAGTAREELLKTNFALETTKQLSANVIATNALNAKSPIEKGEIAAAQTRLSLEKELRDLGKDASKQAELKGQIEARVDSARKLAINSEIAQIKETARVRQESATLAIRTSEVEIQSIGKSVGETYRLTTIEQTRQQLQQEASARHGVIDQKELADLTSKINKNADLKQTQAEMNAANDAAFERQTVFLTDIDKQIASAQRQLHGNNWKDFMGDGLTATLRLTDGLKKLDDSLGSFASGLVTDLSHGVVAADALKTQITRLADSLLDMATRQLMKSALSGLFDSATKNITANAASTAPIASAGVTAATSITASLATAGTGLVASGVELVATIEPAFATAGSALTSGAFELAAAAADITTAAGLLGVAKGASVLHSGGIVGQSGLLRMANPLMFAGAQRFAAGGIPGLGPDEVPIIAHNNEEVITRKDPRHRWNGGNSGSGGSPQIHVSSVVNNHAGVNGVTQTATSDGSGGIRIETMIPPIENALSGRMAKGQGSLSKVSRSISSGRHLRG